MEGLLRTPWSIDLVYLYYQHCNLLSAIHIAVTFVIYWLLSGSFVYSLFVEAFVTARLFAFRTF
jgi:hypothetical protein